MLCHSYWGGSASTLTWICCAASGRRTAKGTALSLRVVGVARSLNASGASRHLNVQITTVCAQHGPFRTRGVVRQHHRPLPEWVNTPPPPACAPFPKTQCHCHFAPHKATLQLLLYHAYTCVHICWRLHRVSVWMHVDVHVCTCVCTGEIF